MGSEAVPFKSPPSLSVSIPLPHKGTVTGMGIPEGITLIVGGGFHGKSTLLQVCIDIHSHAHIEREGEREKERPFCGCVYI